MSLKLRLDDLFIYFVSQSVSRLVLLGCHLDPLQLGGSGFSESTYGEVFFVLFFQSIILQGFLLPLYFLLLFLLQPLHLLLSDMWNKYVAAGFKLLFWLQPDLYLVQTCCSSAIHSRNPLLVLLLLLPTAADQHGRVFVCEWERERGGGGVGGQKHASYQQEATCLTPPLLLQCLWANTSVTMVTTAGGSEVCRCATCCVFLCGIGTKPMGREKDEGNEVRVKDGVTLMRKIEKTHTQKVTISHTHQHVANGKDEREKSTQKPVNRPRWP